MENYKNLDLSDIIYFDEDGNQKTEQWKDIPEYEGYYMVSDLGRIKSVKRIKYLGINKHTILNPKILKQSFDKHGYFKITLSKNRKMKTLKTHQLVMMGFLNHVPDGTTKIVVDHINNIKTDNRIKNLQLITHRKNSSKDKINYCGSTGVSIIKKRFLTNISINNENIYLGCFKTKEEAENKYLEALKMYEKGVSVNEIKKIKTKPIFSVNIKGISITKNNKFRVYDYIGKKYIHLGIYSNLFDAQKALENYWQSKN